MIEDYLQWKKEYFLGDKYYFLHSDNHQKSEQLSLQQFPITHPHLSRHRTMIGFCNGLVCLVELSHKISVTVVICNPSIRRYIKFSTQRRSGTLFGFGYDSKMKDFKLVRVACFWAEGQAEVYSLSSASWRRITDRPPSFLFDETSQIFVNGAIHWVVKKRQNKNIDYSILCFDVIKETFSELMLGPCLKETPSMVTIVPGLSDSIAVCTCYSRSNNQISLISVRVMKEYGVVESWTEICRFDSPYARDIPKVLALRSNGEVLLIRNNGEITLYDSKKCKFVKDMGIGRYTDAFVECNAEAESLFLINSEPY